MVPRKGLARLATIQLISLMKSASHLRSVYQGRVPAASASQHSGHTTLSRRHGKSAVYRLLPHVAEDVRCDDALTTTGD